MRFFEEPGPKNTEEVVQAVQERTREGGIDAVVVASVSGRTAIRVTENLREAGVKVPVVCVTGPPSWEKYAPDTGFRSSPRKTGRCSMVWESPLLTMSRNRSGR